MTTVSIRSVVPSIAASIAWSSRRNLGTGRGRSIDGTSQTAAWRWWSERTTGARSSGEAVFEREGGRGGSCRHAELRVDVLEVACHRVLADHEGRSDVAVRHPGPDQAQHLDLARGEARGQAARLVEQRGGPLSVRASSEPLEGGPSCAQLEPRSFGIARVPHGDAEEHLGPRALVRELEFAPRDAGAPEILERLLRTAIGKTNGTPCRRRGRLERRRADLAGDHGELVTGTARRLDIVRRERDLHECRQQSHPSERATFLTAQGGTEGGRRRVRLALRQAKERQPRLWFEPQPVGAGERVFGAPQIAGPSPDLAALVQRPAGGGGVGDGVLAHPQGFSLGLRPGSSERRYLRPGDTASPRIGAPLWERLAPGRGREAPFAGAP